MIKQLLLILTLSLILTAVASGTSGGGGEIKVGGDETDAFHGDGWILV